MLYHEENLGPFDGSQDAFATSFDYVAGSLRVLTPLLEEGANVTELGGKDFSLADMPLEGDVLIYVYRIL